MTTPAEKSNHYVFDTFTDRDRLYNQFELLREHFAEWFNEALELGGLSADPATANWRMLDVGSGEGLFSTEIITKYPQIEVVGVDIDQEAISTANMFVNPRGKANFFIHNVNDPFPATFGEGVSGHGFDLALVVHVLMHTSNPAKVLSNILQTLKPGGVIVLYDPVADWATYPHPSFESLVTIANEVSRKFANFDFGDRHAETLHQHGMEQINSRRWTRPLGGKSELGQRWFSHLVATIEAARNGLVDRMKVISAKEWDDHVKAIKKETTTDEEGEYHGMITIARKPL